MERGHGIQEVVGSIPSSSTKNFKGLDRQDLAPFFYGQPLGQPFGFTARPGPIYPWGVGNRSAVAKVGSKIKPEFLLNVMAISLKAALKAECLKKT